MNKTIAIIISVGAFCVGCGSSNSNSGRGCADPAGLYHITYTTVSGNCGNQSPVDVVLPEAQSSDCTITGQNTSADNCSASVSESCNTYSTAGEEYLVVSANSNDDGSQITGTIEVRYSNGCSGTYNYTETKTHN